MSSTGQCLGIGTASGKDKGGGTCTFKCKFENDLPVCQGKHTIYITLFVIFIAKFIQDRLNVLIVADGMESSNQANFMGNAQREICKTKYIEITHWKYSWNIYNQMYMNGARKSNKEITSIPSHAWYTAEGEIQTALDADWKNYGDMNY